MSDLMNIDRIAESTGRFMEGPPGGVEADVLAAPVFDDDELDALRVLDAASGGQVARARASGELSGKLFSLVWCSVVDPTWRPQRLLLVGAGPKAGFTSDRLRKVAAAAARAAREHRVARLAWLVRGPLEAGDAVQGAAEGLSLGCFDPARHKTHDRPGPEPVLVVVYPDAGCAGLVERADRGWVLGGATNLARELANEPGNLLTPTRFADRAAAVATEVGLAVEILEEAALERLGMGLLLGVACGSAEPPRLIVLRHEPPGAPSRPVLALVGKGVTFDTGGISLKPADGMERMKDDMAGGAAVVAAMRAIATLGAPIRVVGVVPAVENMPGGRALKPGDVLASASGKTVEVVNTDAEGRLILADALWYAQRLGATHLVDAATLTGACTVALGRLTTGLFGAPDAWVEHVRRVAGEAGERAWPMPLFDDYAEALRSDIADLVNSAGRAGGAITAAMFLREFTGGLPWAHLDIAGTAWADEAKPYQPKGATGAAVRTLAALACTSDRWPV